MSIENKRNYSILFNNERNFKSLSLLLPENVEDLFVKIPFINKKFKLHLNNQNNKLLNIENILLKNDKVLAFRINRVLMNQIYYIQIAYVLHKKFKNIKLIYNNSYEEVGVECDLTTPIFIPKKLKIRINNKLNCEYCDLTLMNNFCFKCEYENFILSLNFEFESLDLLISECDLLKSNFKEICGKCLTCKRCKKKRGESGLVVVDNNFEQYDYCNTDFELKCATHRNGCPHKFNLKRDTERFLPKFL